MSRCYEAVRRMADDYRAEIEGLEAEVYQARWRISTLEKVEWRLRKILENEQDTADADEAGEAPRRRPIQATVIEEIKKLGGITPEDLDRRVIEETGADEHSVHRTLRRMVAAGKLSLDEGRWYSLPAPEPELQ